MNNIDDIQSYLYDSYNYSSPLSTVGNIAKKVGGTALNVGKTIGKAGWNGTKAIARSGVKIGKVAGNAAIGTAKFIAHGNEHLDNLHKGMINKARSVGTVMGAPGPNMLTNFAQTEEYIGYYIVILNGPSATIEGPFNDTKSLQKAALRARVMGFEIKIVSSKEEAQKISEEHNNTVGNGAVNKVNLSDKSVTYGPGGQPIHQTSINFSEKFDEEGFPIPDTFENLMTETMINGPKQWYVVCGNTSKGPFTEGVATQLYKELLNNNREMMVRLVHKV